MHVPMSNRTLRTLCTRRAKTMRNLLIGTLCMAVSAGALITLLPK